MWMGIYLFIFGSMFKSIKKPNLEFWDLIRFITSDFPSSWARSYITVGWILSVFLGCVTQPRIMFLSPFSVLPDYFWTKALWAWGVIKRNLIYLLDAWWIHTLKHKLFLMFTLWSSFLVKKNHIQNKINYSRETYSFIFLGTHT